MRNLEELTTFLVDLGFDGVTVFTALKEAAEKTGPKQGRLQPEDRWLAMAVQDREQDSAS